eukprot:g3067.t1
MSYEIQPVLDPTEWKCCPCPNGASCRGETTWEEVKAEMGYWRYEEAGIGEDAFVPCLYDPQPSANEKDEAKIEEINKQRPCLGARAGSEPDSNLTAVTEGCNEAQGYQQQCANRSSGLPMACRLCATCAPGYKRSGDPGQCKKCPEKGQNRVLIAFGGVGLICGMIGLVVITIKSESEDAVSDAAKKIIINYGQLIALARSLPLKWPSGIQSMFTFFNYMTSGGTAVVVPDCELSEEASIDAANIFYGKVIVVGIAPFICVALCVMAWIATYSQSYARANCGNRTTFDA